MAIGIGQLTFKCRAPPELVRDEVRPREFLDRLLAVVRRDLAPALSRGLAELQNQPGIAFIEALDFELAVNVDRPAEEIAKRIACELARSLWSKLADPGTVAFRDSAELWARFILDATRGAAYTRSWHAEFPGLRALSTSGILRTLIETGPDLAVRALTRLTRADLRRALACLAPADASRAVTALTASAAAPCCDAERIASALLVLGDWRGDDPRSQLALLIELKREMGVETGLVTLQLAETLRALADRTTFAPELQDGATFLTCGPLPSSDWRQYLANHGPAVTAALERLRGSCRPESALVSGVSLGGLWLLLPHVLEQLEALDEPEANLPIAYSTLALSSGPNVQEIWADRGLRTLLGVALRNDELLRELGRSLPRLEQQALVVRRGRRAFTCARAVTSAISDDTFRRLHMRRVDISELIVAGSEIELPFALTRLLARLAYRALRAYARRLPGFGGSSNEYLWRNFLATPATLWTDASSVRVVLADPALHVIWRISGADRAAYTLPDGRTVSTGVRQ